MTPLKIISCCSSFFWGIDVIIWVIFTPSTDDQGASTASAVMVLYLHRTALWWIYLVVQLSKGAVGETIHHPAVSPPLPLPRLPASAKPTWSRRDATCNHPAASRDGRNTRAAELSGTDLSDSTRGAGGQEGSNRHLQ